MNTVIFHGTLLPERDWARAVEADVVLQAYHPIVQAQHFAEWFPRARRFVYVNPTAVDRLRRTDVTDDMVVDDPDDRWHLPRLRLPEWLDWAVGDAVDIGQAPGIDGLFVDDLDRLIRTPAGRDMAIGYVRRVAESTGATMYVNRAFPILDTLPAVEAVLVEDVDRDLAAPGVGTWLDEVVVPALKRARSRGVRVHRLDYGFDPPAPGAHAAANAKVNATATSITRLAHPVLDQWSWWVGDGTTPHSQTHTRTRTMQ